MINVFDVWGVWVYVGGQYYIVIIVGFQIFNIYLCVQVNIYVVFVQYDLEIVQGFIEFFFFGNLFGYIELVINFIVGVEQGDFVVMFCCY